LPDECLIKTGEIGHPRSGIEVNRLADTVVKIAIDQDILLVVQSNSGRHIVGAAAHSPGPNQTTLTVELQHDGIRRAGARELVRPRPRIEIDSPGEHAGRIDIARAVEFEIEDDGVVAASPELPRPDKVPSTVQLPHEPVEPARGGDLVD